MIGAHLWLCDLSCCLRPSQYSFVCFTHFRCYSTALLLQCYRKGLVLTLLKIFSVVTVTMLMGIIIAQALIIWLVKDLSHAAIAIRAYTTVEAGADCVTDDTQTCLKKSQCGMLVTVQPCLKKSQSGMLVTPQTCLKKSQTGTLTTLRPCQQRGKLELQRLMHARQRL